MMNRDRALAFVFILLFLVSNEIYAQRADTTRPGIRQLELRLELQPDLLLFPLSETAGQNNFYGSYEIYSSNFTYSWRDRMASKNLEYALKAIAEEQDTGKFLELLNKLDPYINNVFEFGHYKIYDLPIIERDHPYFWDR